MRLSRVTVLRSEVLRVAVLRVTDASRVTAVLRLPKVRLSRVAVLRSTVLRVAVLRVAPASLLTAPRVAASRVMALRFAVWRSGRTVVVLRISRALVIPSFLFTKARSG